MQYAKEKAEDNTFQNLSAHASHPSRENAALCLHCAKPLRPHQVDYCCGGCETLAHYLSQHPDALNQNTFSWKPTHQDSLIYQYLDDEEERKKYLEDLSDGLVRVRFFLEGIHCSSCLLLVEKLTEILPGIVKNTRLQFQQAIVTVDFISEGSITLIAQTLNQLGYPPTPLQINTQEQIQKLISKDHRKFLTRIAVAGACTGNIMLFAISIYAGAEGVIKERFDWISFFLSLPVLFYSARPIFVDAWKNLKQKQWTIDAPIVIALSVGWGVSLWGLLVGKPYNFVDSLSGLVFFLLSSRYVLMRLQQNVFIKTESLDPLFPKRVQLKDGSEKKTSDLQIGDLIYLHSQMKAPADGTIREGEVWMDLSLLNGESVPEKCGVGQKVYAGTLSQSGECWVEIEKTKNNTRLGQMITTIQSFDPHHNSIARLSNKIAKIFTISVVFLSTFVLAYFTWVKGDFGLGLTRTLMLLIVSCPCAFALATPLALSFAFTLLLKKGIYLKNISSLEKVLNIRHIVFDKTGTLTQGTLSVQEIKPLIPLDPQTLQTLKKLIYQIEQRSQHPFAIALVQYLHSQVTDPSQTPPSLLKIENIEEEIGKGVRCRFENKNYRITSFSDKPLNSATESRLSQVALFENNQPILSISFTNELRPEVPLLFETLKKHFTLWICSGDKKTPVQTIAQDLHLTADHAKYELSPEQKVSFLDSLDGPTLYIGDGANDGLVLAHAGHGQQGGLGIAAFGAFDLSLKSAQGYFLKPQLKALVDLIHIAKETDTLLRRHFIFTILYNTIAIGLAITGYLTPFIAAILMPLSSLIVLLSTAIGTSGIRSIRQEER
jgi:Cu2+-exporting ATPase/Cu+-exporting ATPase